MHSVQTSLDDQEELVTFGRKIKQNTFGVDSGDAAVSVHSVQTSLDDEEELVPYGVEVLVDSVSVHSVQTSLDDQEDVADDTQVLACSAGFGTEQ